MGILEMKKDIQEAISNSIQEYYANYGSLVFDQKNKEYIKSLFFIKELNIKIENNKLLYKIKLDENIINEITEKDKIKIQKKYLERRIKNIFKEKIHLDKIIDYYKTDIMCQFIKEKEENYKNKREANQNDISKMKLIQKILKEYFKIDSEIKTGENFVYLESIQNEYFFDKGMLGEIEDIFNQIDMFAITPIFTGEKTTNIRLFFAIDLNKEE